MFKYRLLISYDGTTFSGWQIQPNANSIQEEIEKALFIALKTPIRVIGAGRTDAGVHAKGQVAHFESLIQLDCDRFLLCLNGLLPHAIRIRKMEQMDAAFHARFSAVGKEYHYHLWFEKSIDPFCGPYRYHVRFPFDRSLLESASSYFIGTHDFATFTNVGSSATSSVRTIRRLEVIEQEGGLRLEFEGDGFFIKWFAIL